MKPFLMLMLAGISVVMSACVVEDHRPPRTVVVHERSRPVVVERQVVVERPVVVKEKYNYHCPPGQAKKGRC